MHDERLFVSAHTFSGFRRDSNPNDANNPDCHRGLVPSDLHTYLTPSSGYDSHP
jgi:hypothetical protein